MFDRAALDRQRCRAQRQTADVWFLHDQAIDITQERLKEVNRTFTNPAIVGWRASEWATGLGMNAICVSDSDTLNLAQGAHDLVIHALGLHWANDPVGQLVQMRRALQPDGLMIAVLFAGQTLHELRTSLAEAESKVLGGISPHVAPMGEIRDLGGLLQRAGFALPVADVVSLNTSYASPISLMSELRAMGEANVMVARQRGMMRRSVLEAACDIYTRAFGLDDHRVAAQFDMAFLTGWAPSPDQQKPLRPGSAQQRLADALGVPEQDPKV